MNNQRRAISKHKAAHNILRSLSRGSLSCVNNSGDFPNKWNVGNLAANPTVQIIRLHYNVSFSIFLKTSRFLLSIIKRTDNEAVSLAFWKLFSISRWKKNPKIAPNHFQNNIVLSNLNGWAQRANLGIVKKAFTILKIKPCLRRPGQSLILLTFEGLEFGFFFLITHGKIFGFSLSFSHFSTAQKLKFFLLLP